MEFELGQTYSGYKFLDVAKRSKTGVEYRVQNTLAQRMELLKVLPAGAQDDQEETDRFLREMRVRARLVHPNIVMFFTAMPLEGRLAMTTELVEGLPLSERLQLGPIPWREALAFARQVLSAAGCAHEQKIVHRDITPDNIIAVPGGVMKLSNFRLAKPVNSLHLTHSGAVLGNVKYISPEQVKGTVPVDHRGDLYSIGIVLYEMLAGRPPFSSASQFEVMLAHVNQQPEPPSRFTPSIPPELDAVVLKALAKSPAERHQSAREFGEALDKVVAPTAAPTGRPVVEPVPQAALPVQEPSAPVVKEPPAPVVEVASPAPIPIAVVREPAPQVMEVAASAPIAVAVPQETVPPVVEMAASAPIAVAVAEEPAPPVVEEAASEPIPIAVAQDPAPPVVEEPASEPIPIAVAEEPAPPVVEMAASEPIAIAVPRETAPPVVEEAASELIPIAVAEEPAPPVVDIAASAPIPVAVPQETAPPVVEMAASAPIAIAVVEGPAPRVVEVTAEPIPIAVAQEPAPPVSEVAASEPIPIAVAEEQAPPLIEAAPSAPIDLAVAAAEQPATPVAAESEPVASPEPVAAAVAGELAPPVVAAAEPVLAPEPIAVPVAGEPAPQAGEAASPVAEEPVPPAADASEATPPSSTEAVPLPIAAAIAADPPPAPAPAAAPEPAPALLPETVVHASLWAAAEIVARAVAAPDLADSDAGVGFAPPHLVPIETAPGVSGPAVAPAGPVASPTVVPIIRPGPVAPVATPSPYDAARFLAAAGAKSQSIQWAVLGGTAAFLGVVWVTIWLVTGK